MDLFTHALLPYLLGKFFKRNKEEVAAFVLGGIAPDFDFLILWINYIYPTFFLITHRGITHSFFFGFFTSLAVLYLASRTRVKTKVQKFVDFNPVVKRGTIMFAGMGMAVHLFLDYITTRGIPLFYPLSTHNYSAEVFFYTDIYLTVVSLIIIIFLFKKPLQKNTITKFLVLFLVIFAALGSLRLAEKKNAEDFFTGEDIKAYPTMDPFDWYALSVDADTVNIYEYDGLERTKIYSGAVPRLNISSQGEGIEKAFSAADELPQVKMFKWRANVIAVNASFNNGIWSLQYYDPLQRATARGMQFIRGISGGLNVTVEDGKASISRES